jgi:hypothetical protein
MSEPGVVISRERLWSLTCQSYPILEGRGSVCLCRRIAERWADGQATRNGLRTGRKVSNETPAVQYCYNVLRRENEQC